MPPDSAVSIAVLYPELLGTYGDWGNAVVLAQRLRWRGIDADVVTVGAGETPPTSCQLYVMGGEGFADELDLIRAHKGVNAVNIISSEWTGWAAVDTLNSAFLGQQPKNSGIGWTLCDPSSNLPPSGAFVPKVDFKAVYSRAWGVSG